MQEPILLDLRKFVAPEFIFGTGARHLAGQYVVNLGARKVLVVTDPGVIAAGWTADVVASLDEAGVEHVTYSEVTPNPRDHEVMAGRELYESEGCDAIVAVGGGSPMDCAKGIGMATANQRHILKFEGVDKVDTPGPPLICVPTTAGSSADVSQFAIINDTARKVKIAIVSKSIIPDAALIDPETCVSMPPELTANTGLDALTHAVEAFVSNAHSPVTDLFALDAIRLVSRHLPTAWREPGNIEARGKVCLGSLYAGLAFSNAILGAVHAMAHALGGFLDLPHGECNAILLDAVIDYNYDATPTRYDKLAEVLGADGCALAALSQDERKQATLAAVRGLKQTLGVTRTLGQLGVTPADLPELSAKALADACMITNPKGPTAEDLIGIYERSL